MKLSAPKLWAVVALGLTCVCSSRAVADEPAKEATALFDGRTLNGWEGNLKAFRVQDGAIGGGTLAERNPRNEFLCTQKD